MDKEQIIASMATREFIYRYLSRFYVSYVDMDFLKTIESDAATGHIKLFCGEENIANAFQKLLRETAFTYDFDPEETGELVSLRRAYDDLFVKGKKALGKGCETFYGASQSEGSQSTISQIRDVFEKYDFSAAAGLRQPVDFLGCELEFMTEMAHKTKAALIVGNFAGALDLLYEQLNFLREHLSYLISCFTTRLRAYAASVADFYLYAAELSLHVCRYDENYLQRIIDGISEATSSH